MTNAIVLFFKNYLNFSGRSRRSEYWWAILGVYIINMLLGSTFAGGLLMSNNGENPEVALVPMALYLLFSIAIVIPSVSLTVRRLHDVGKSGWWMFISCVPCVGQILYLIFMCTDSQPGDNQWGPNPKAIYYQGK